MGMYKTDILQKELINELRIIDNLIIEDENNHKLLNKSVIMEYALKVEPKLIKVLLNNAKLKQSFFTNVDEVLVFDKIKFQRFVNNKSFLPDSYTSFKQNIGLTFDPDGNDSLKACGDVVLSWPYKDCVLEGGQTKDDAKRNEIFWNNILAPEQIDRLLQPKAFTNFKKFDKDGEHKIREFKGDENLIIKGNNLLSLYSLKEKYACKIKLIYIDPPYNPKGKSNTFLYNNSFNHSTWLTFMKNRLDVAKELLSEDGTIIIAIDENEQPYLGVLLDEIFDNHERHCITIVHNPRGVQGTNFSYSNEYAYFIFPNKKEIICDATKESIDWRGLRDNGGESRREDAKNCFYPIIIDKTNNQVIDFGKVCIDEVHPKKNIIDGDFIEIYPIDNNGIERKWRYARQSVDKIKDLLRVNVVNNVYDIQLGKDFEKHKTVWIDKRYDANEYGTKLVKKLVPTSNFSFPKSLWNVYDCINAVVKNDKNSIILDFFGGSGTTAHATIECNKEDGGNRKFIICEQMDYINTVTVPRVQKVIEQEGKGSFVYCELKEYNQEYVNRINLSTEKYELKDIWEDMKHKSFLNYRVDTVEIDTKLDAIMTQDIVKIKKLLFDLLDMNQLYLNYSEIEDNSYEMSDIDKKLNNQFYKK